MGFCVVMRGGGDLASGAVLRLARAGIHTVITELAQPLAVRRQVSFAEAVYSQTIEIEGQKAQLVKNPSEIFTCFQKGEIPVLIDPESKIIEELRPQVVVDGRMRKAAPDWIYPAAYFTIGLGPGFIAGENCDTAIETQRGPLLGRVYWQGSPESDTGQPEAVGNQTHTRVIRAPVTGQLETLVKIGDILTAGAPVARVGEDITIAQIPGVVRGLLHNGLQVKQGMKIGDIDPRSDPALCSLVSDKALAVGGGVMEAILSVPRLREMLWRQN
jgi:xanthine dehydrogenase accessory factor